MTRPITVAILGAGGRGTGFAQLINTSGYAGLGQVVGVAEPREAYRNAIAQSCALADNMVFHTWQEFVAQPKLCDAVVISTMDRDHVGPALACFEKGYHVLLEKPMATSLADCQAIEAAQRKAGTMAIVCHSLRYQKGFHKVKELLDAGRVGRIMSVDQLERVSYWHQAHSFVRGNWANEDRSTSMLMSKSCHDIDYLSYLIGVPCLRTASSGALSFFTAANAPAGSTARCTEGCAVERDCPYSAIKAYVESDHLDAWPANMVSPVHTREAHREAIASGPYGRCVYRCDNDVVDHQVVLLEYANDITATFTMTAFTQGGGRWLRVHGTEGELSFDEAQITVRTFADGNMETIALGHESGGHGGGDWRVVNSWLRAIRENDPSFILTNVQESLRTHTIVFAAEQSRREQRMVEIAELSGVKGSPSHQ